MIGAATGEGWDVNAAQLTPAASAIGSFAFGGDPDIFVNTFTAEADSQSVDTGGHDLPGASWNNVTGAGVSLVIEAYYVNWNGVNFNQGSNTFLSFTVDPSCTINCNYSAEWRSLIDGGPFEGITGSWKISGTISAVPVPATVWLISSGLIGLVGVARRRVTN